MPVRSRHPRSPAGRGGEGIEAVQFTHGGVKFRSILEASWACTLDHHGIEWRYEPWLLNLPSGVRYMPDFWLPKLRTFIEVKSAQMDRIAKAYELAETAAAKQVITLIGFPPVMRNLQPYLSDPYMQWRDPLGYDTRFALCGHCSAWQWLRPQLSRACRACGTLHEGLLAKAGELPFITAQPERYRRLTFGTPAGQLCRGSRQTTVFTMTWRSSGPARQP